MIIEALNILLITNFIASAVILLLLLLRNPIRKMLGVGTAYTLWAIVPLTAAAAFLPQKSSVISILNNNFSAPHVKLFEQASFAPLAEAAPSIPATTVLQHVLTIFHEGVVVYSIFTVWVIGAILTIGVFIVRQHRFTKMLGNLAPTQSRHFQSQTSGIGPALVGVLKPKIIVPHDFEDRFDVHEREMIIAHERAHLTAGDVQINSFVALLRCVNWFNPLVHIAAQHFYTDQELACDARVIAQFPSQKKHYAQALLKTQLSNHRLPVGCFWPESSQHALKERIKALQFPHFNLLRRIVSSLLAFSLSFASVGAVWALNPAHSFTQGRLIVPGISPSASSQEQALINAALMGDLKQVSILLEAKVDPNVSIPPYGTAMIVAARRGDFDIVEKLIANGARINLASRGEGFPLLAAIEGGRKEIVAYLLDHGAHANVLVPEGDASPLSSASKIGDASLVQLLLDHGADPNMTVEDEGSPLIAAAASGQISVVDMLVKAGANVKKIAPVERRGPTNNVSHENTTALIEAQRNNHTEIAIYLEREEKRHASMPIP